MVCEFIQINGFEGMIVCWWSWRSKEAFGHILLGSLGQTASQYKGSIFAAVHVLSHIEILNMSLWCSWIIKHSQIKDFIPNFPI